MDACWFVKAVRTVHAHLHLSQRGAAGRRRGKRSLRERRRGECSILGNNESRTLDPKAYVILPARGKEWRCRQAKKSSWLAIINCINLCPRPSQGSLITRILSEPEFYILQAIFPGLAILAWARDKRGFPRGAGWNWKYVLFAPDLPKHFMGLGIQMLS